MRKKSVSDNIEVLDFDDDNHLEKKHRRVKKGKLVLLIVSLLLISGAVTGGLIYKNNLDKKRKAEEEERQRVLTVKEITSHYGNYVKVTKDADIYDDKMNVIGKIYQDEEIALDEIEEITDKTKYFNIHDIGQIKYEDVESIEKMSSYSDRYKNYLPFNKNVVLKGGYTLYTEDGKKAYSFTKGSEYPILIDDYDGKYYVEYNNRLMYVLKEDVEKTVSHNNTTKKNAAKVTTLCYHRIYDTKDKCDDVSICKKKSAFDQEMKYLKDNHYFTFTMEEMYLYLTKKLQVEKAVVITLDDGWLVKSAIDVLEKYDLHGTSFLKTKIWDDLSGFKSDNLELQSHTHNMHTPGVCKKEASYQQGGGILCLSEDKVLDDLKTSREKLNGAIALAYPFYDYNSRAIKLVKKAGFKLAFIGAAGVKGKSSPGIDVYKIPRMTIWDTTTFSKWKSYL